MKTIILIVLLIFGLVLIFEPKLKAKHDPGKMRKTNNYATRHTVTVLVYKDGKYVGNGSGVIIDIIDGHSYVVTSNHVITAGDDWEVLYGKSKYPVKVLRIMKGEDGPAFLRVEAIIGSGVKVGKPELHDNVLMKGTAKGITDMTYHAYVTGFMEPELMPKSYNTTIWLLDQPMSRGMSGGGVWNEKGEFIGMMHSVIVLDWRTVTLITPAEWIFKQYWRFGIYQKNNQTKGGCYER